MSTAGTPRDEHHRDTARPRDCLTPLAGRGKRRRCAMRPHTIGVVGAGLMGHGIAYLLAAAGHTVRIYDPSPDWRASLPQRLESARALLDGDPALLARISAHETM